MERKVVVGQEDRQCLGRGRSEGRMQSAQTVPLAMEEEEEEGPRRLQGAMGALDSSR